jgi:hypothetical protein
MNAVARCSSSKPDKAHIQFIEKAEGERLAGREGMLKPI